MALSVKELQIGDWVINPVHNDCSKIESVYYDKELHCLVGTDGRFPQQYFDPIPLTADILEKNGWERRSCHYVLYLRYDRLSISLGESYSQFGHSHLCGVGTDCVEVEYCSEIDFVGTLYVHQLQHALRLCGLNDLADNFKV